ncbi:MAG: signal recognition particle-docking protein FtsY, partial [Gaiellaceae bacterium]
RPLRVTRSWAEFLGDDEEAPEDAERQRGWFGRLRESLTASRQALTRELLFDPSDDEAWERIEEALIAADCGVPATVEIVQRLEAREPRSQAELVEGLEEVVADLVAADGQDRLGLDRPPSVVLVVGVNGTGKTTTIGKLAHRLRESGRSVVLAAADTFRAAADEQLEIWAERAGADFVGAQRGADPAAVAFDAIASAEARGRDVVVVDTAGRLHTQTNLMEELAKIRRVIAGRLEGAPHETLLVLDATTGQNGLRQAQLFDQAVDVSGVALTKLDGTAKGGVAVAVTHELGLPVKLIGVGESLDDLQPFDPRDFARALIAAQD